MSEPPMEKALPDIVPDRMACRPRTDTAAP
jgi:hypothetical protein